MIFVPTTAGTAAAGSLVVNSNAGDPSLTVKLKGKAKTGAITIDPKLLNFGKVTLDQSSSAMTVTLTNQNALDMTLEPPSLSDPTHQYSISQTNCTSVLIADGGTCSISVRFTPTVKGSAKATLQIGDDAADSPQTVKLSGSGD